MSRCTAATATRPSDVSGCRANGSSRTTTPTCARTRCSTQGFSRSTTAISSAPAASSPVRTASSRTPTRSRTPTTGSNLTTPSLVSGNNSESGSTPSGPKGERSAPTGLRPSREPDRRRAGSAHEAADGWGPALLLLALAMPYLLPWYAAWFAPFLGLMQDDALLWIGVAATGMLALTLVPADPFHGLSTGGVMLGVHYL